MKIFLTIFSLLFAMPCFAGNDTWGEHIPGVIDKLNVHENQKIVALTFDLCGKNIDSKLIKYLVDNDIKATLFVTGIFIKHNKQEFIKLSKYKNFDIENHGQYHRVASITGKSVYGIRGFNSAQGLIDEIKNNEATINQLTGKKTILYRSGGAYYENVAMGVISKLGYKVIGFAINGDYGSTATKLQIFKNVSAAKNGDIVLDHIGRPQSDVRQGVIPAIEKLKSDGFKFVFVKDYIK